MQSFSIKHLRSMLWFTMIFLTHSHLECTYVLNMWKLSLKWNNSSHKNIINKFFQSVLFVLNDIGIKYELQISRVEIWVSIDNFRLRMV